MRIIPEIQTWMGRLICKPRLLQSLSLLLEGGLLCLTMHPLLHRKVALLLRSLTCPLDPFEGGSFHNGMPSKSFFALSCFTSLLFSPHRRNLAFAQHPPHYLTWFYPVLVCCCCVLLWCCFWAASLSWVGLVILGCVSLVGRGGLGGGAKWVGEWKRRWRGEWKRRWSGVAMV